MYNLGTEPSTSEEGRLYMSSITSGSSMLYDFGFIAHRYVKSVAVWDLIVDDGLYIYCFQLELYGDINEPWKRKKTNRQMVIERETDKDWVAEADISRCHNDYKWPETHMEQDNKLQTSVSVFVQKPL